MLRVRMFGDLDFRLDEQPLDGFASNKAQLVFAYLLLNPDRRYERGHLATQFWGDLPEMRARKALKTEVWRICQALKKAGLDPDQFLIRRHTTIGARCSGGFWTDVGAFELYLEHLTGLEPEDCSHQVVRAITAAVELCHADLLEGVFDDWCLVRREALVLQRGKALDFLLRYHMHHERWQDALDYGQELLQLDSMLEHVYRALMRCHYAMGNRAAAIKLYEKCRHVLSDELGICPMEETEQLCQYMLAHKSADDSESGTFSQTSEWSQQISGL